MRHKNGLLLFLFFENLAKKKKKHLDDAKRRKRRRGWPWRLMIYTSIVLLCTCSFDIYISQLYILFNLLFVYFS